MDEILDTQAIIVPSDLSDFLNVNIYKNPRYPHNAVVWSNLLLLASQYNCAFIRSNFNFHHPCATFRYFASTLFKAGILENMI